MDIFHNCRHGQSGPFEGTQGEALLPLGRPGVPPPVAVLLVPSPDPFENSKATKMPWATGTAQIGSCGWLHKEPDASPLLHAGTAFPNPFMQSQLLA